MALETGLELNYEFEGNSNDNKDSFNGTDTAISYSTSYGKYLQGALLNGTTSKIVVGNSTVLQTPPFTLALWMKVVAYPSVYGMVWAGIGGLNGLQIILDSAGKMNLAKNTVTIQGTSNTALGTTLRRFVVLTYDATTIRFYLDGAADGTPTSNLTYAQQTIDIGTDGTYFSNVEIDNVSWWSVIKTADEITELYASGNGMHFNGSLFVNNVAASGGAFLLNMI